MTANFHTHTKRCGHATGTNEEYVLAAINAGFKTLGFSDHAPYYYPDGYVSWFKMTPSELPEYSKSVNELREKYRGTINIHLGLEAEYYPELFGSALELWRKNGIEYLILGQHFVGKEYVEGVFHSTQKSDKEHLRLYTDTVIAAMETGKFSYLAHPDVLNYTDDDAFYEHEVRRLAEASIRCGVPIEFNLLGLYSGRHYPRDYFWKTVSVLHPTVVIGVDAHTPEAFARTETFSRAREILQSNGLRPVSELNFKPL